MENKNRGKLNKFMKNNVKIQNECLDKHLNQIFILGTLNQTKKL